MFLYIWIKENENGLTIKSDYINMISKYDLHK